MAYRGRGFESGFVRGALGEVECREAYVGLLDAVVKDDAGEFGERGGVVAGTAESAGVGRNDVGEGIALAFPGGEDELEGVLLHHGADAGVLRGEVFALEEPLIDFLAHVGAFLRSVSKGRR